MRSARRAVGVSADHNLPTGSRPLDDPPVGTTLLPDVVREARIASHAETLEMLKDTHRAPANYTQPVALEISLVPVHDKHLLSGLGVFQDQPLVGDQSSLVYTVSLAILNVMVADDEVQPALAVKLVQQIKDIPMSTPDIAEPAVLPKLIAIPDLDIGKPVPEIVAQGMEKKPFVLGKDIRPAVVPAMTVAEKDDACMRRGTYPQRLVRNLTFSTA
jgi:hypothetical protein